jgi:hypothetical protein
MLESPAIADGASTRNDASAYLRVAHIYMLISMPTGTSTIFGAFQAIWALPFFETGRKNSPLAIKVLRIKAFATPVDGQSVDLGS